MQLTHSQKLGDLFKSLISAWVKRQHFLWMKCRQVGHGIDFLVLLTIFWQTLQDGKNGSLAIATDGGKLIVRNLFSCLSFARELNESVSICAEVTELKGKISFLH